MNPQKLSDSMIRITKTAEEDFDYNELIQRKNSRVRDRDVLNEEIAKIDAILAECAKLGIGV